MKIHEKEAAQKNVHLPTGLNGFKIPKDLCAKVLTIYAT